MGLEGRNGRIVQGVRKINSNSSDLYEISGAELDMALRRAAQGESLQAILLDIYPEYLDDTREVEAMLRSAGVITETSKKPS